MLFFKKTNKSSEPGGRKYKLAILFALLCLIGYGLTTLNPIFVKTFSDLITGLITIFLIYCGGNVSNKAVLGKWQSAKISDTNSSVINEEKPSDI